MTNFIWGACAMASLVIAAYFWKFYRRTSDRLHAMFALAFVAFSVHWVGLGLVQPEEDTRHYFYVLRLLAFLLIAVAIIDKNRTSE
jgi:hypothetical protein